MYFFLYTYPYLYSVDPKYATGLAYKNVSHLFRYKNLVQNSIFFKFYDLLKYWGVIKKKDIEPNREWTAAKIWKIKLLRNMAADEKNRFIQYLVDKVNTYELDKRATELAVEEFQSRFDSKSPLARMAVPI